MKPAKRSARLWTTPPTSAAGSRDTRTGKPQIRNYCAMFSSQGTLWVRTGDLMRKDEKGYFYFVDRIGDTFRWKGENVATSEVSEAICAFPGVKHANVYGVAVPATEGRAGMAALVAEDALDLVGFRKHLMVRLPPYAQTFVPAHPE